MRPPKPTLTEQELEIMKVVWQLETATVRQVYETMLEHRRIAYTTVMTMMNILEQKGYLKKRQDDRAYVYRPSQPKQQVIRSMVRSSSTGFLTGRRSLCWCTWWRISIWTLRIWKRFA